MKILLVLLLKCIATIFAVTEVVSRLLVILIMWDVSLSDEYTPVGDLLWRKKSKENNHE